ncbi:Non-reducing end beta-L-arabinofuranosidase [Botrimarina colliarenosi]|uniref:Non-reducing end beta-L-arabinofuranosidase n=1 Tax=Botrimarina colliarenosi TaxID=2528001 RepID=A0A5C6AE34_9BACT|nr:beta-L-arabinofuranosidase domain-containing protein [Botrimarina colliarenosi]TWT97680.1 Non-reducing end beta-L-arabinofuranosidase [Botrimarina colliarenosi]
MSVRPLLVMVLATLPTAVATAEPLAVADTSVSPHAAVRPVGVDEVHWTDGFWADRLRVCRDVSIPAMGELMRDSRYKPFYEHFLIAAGEAEGDYHGAAWNDGDYYKWIEAACSSLAVEPNAELQATVDEAVRAVVAAQRADGYLHTPVLIRQRNGDKTAQPFSDRHDFEVYNLGHLMTAGCVRYRVSGKRDLLAAAERAAQFLEAAFAEPTPAMARQAVCPSHYMGLIELYRTTRNERYLRLAQHVIGLRNLAAGVAGGGGDDNQDRIPFVDQREAVGHAVRANYLYAGAADLYLETGDPALVEPLEAVWRNVTQKKLYVTGACGALFDGASPDGAIDQSEITRIHQAYGRNYQLPSEVAHNETCAALGAVFWNWRRFLATGEARHLDWIELAMHNAVLAGVSLEGADYFYTNPLRVTDPAPTELRWSRTREPFIVSFCCPPNVVRTVAQLGGYAYSKSPGALWVNLYGANTLETDIDGETLRLRQETEYPWEGQIRFVIEEAPKKPVALRFRVPNWAGGKIDVQGPTHRYKLGEKPAPTRVHNEKGFHEIKTAWRSGDVLTVTLPMPVVPLESHPLVEETRNQIAVKRGPIVYCLESIDLPDGVQLEQVGLDVDAAFRVLPADESLHGARAIEADLSVSAASPWRTLYRPATGGDELSIKARLIPYYAWGNRGPSEMTVWLPRR